MPLSSAVRAASRHRVTPSGAPGWLALAIALPLFAGACESVSLEGITPSLSDDSPLANAVIEALSANPELARFSLKARSLDAGTVRLSGLVDTDRQRVAAEQAALEVPGVRSVVNTIFLLD